MQNNLEKLIYHFEQLPGIGPRQARRFVYSLLRRRDSDLREFGELLSTIKKHAHMCPSCGLFHTDSESDCSYCRDTSRDTETLLLVEKDADLETVERSGLYRGYYLVLGGVLPVTGKNQVREDLLKKVVAARTSAGLTEIVLGLSATIEGDRTREYVLEILADIVPDTVTITTLGRGLATGTELEYSDTETLKSALSNRK